MTKQELYDKRDELREKGADIIITPVREGHHGFKRRYTYKIYYRTKDGRMDHSEASKVLGSYESYDTALKSAIKDAERMTFYTTGEADWNLEAILKKISSVNFVKIEAYANNIIVVLADKYDSFKKIAELINYNYRSLFTESMFDKFKKEGGQHYYLIDLNLPFGSDNSIVFFTTQTLEHGGEIKKDSGHSATGTTIGNITWTHKNNDGGHVNSQNPYNEDFESNVILDENHLQYSRFLKSLYMVGILKTELFSEKLWSEILEFFEKNL